MPLINDTKCKAIKLSKWIHWLIENTGLNLKMTASIPKQTNFKPISYKDVSYHSNQTNDPYRQKAYIKDNAKFYSAIQYSVSKYLHDNSDLADKLLLSSGIEYYKRLASQYNAQRRDAAKFSNQYRYLEANIYKKHKEDVTNHNDKRIVSNMPVKWNTIIKRLDAYINSKGVRNTPNEDIVEELHFLQKLIKRDAAKPSSYKFGVKNSIDNLNTGNGNIHNDYYRYLCQHPVLRKFLRIKPINGESLIVKRNNHDIKLTHTEFSELMLSASRVPKKYITKHINITKQRHVNHYLKEFRKFVSKIPDDDLKYDIWPMLKTNFKYISKLEHKKE